MRLWSLHPRYLDCRGLVALWREALLAQAVLRGETRGYRRHPQLERFQEQTSPRAAIAGYLRAVHEESLSRGYAFDQSKIGPSRGGIRITVTDGQLEYEWRHLLGKLRFRSPSVYSKWRGIRMPDPHPLFRVRPGVIEDWERPRKSEG
ncbi:MAG: pyrimidine dimer DNA glycosylase/endonuclease V [bacterium]|nr:pyrimidine dimer DNA glycosylase/endonuclease V [bacterium]